MKYFISILFCLLPLCATASVLLGNCDDKTYDVIVKNGGRERVVTLQKGGAEIEEYGPIATISFQIKDSQKLQPVMVPLSPYEEFCIWSGKIKVQRLNTGGSRSGGFSLR